MPEVFSGRWRLRVTEVRPGFDQRVRVSSADSGDGVYPALAGTTLEVSGNNWTAALEWDDGSGAGWRESAVLRSVELQSPLVNVHVLAADTGNLAGPQPDFADLVVVCEDLDPIFDVVQRPFALDHDALTMLPDGIFDVSQGVHYLGLRVRNTWEFDWVPDTGVMIGVSESSRAELPSLGIGVLDDWPDAEQRALQQEVVEGFVRVPSLGVGEEHVIYFKLDVSDAELGKPVIRFAVRQDVRDGADVEPSREVEARVFISRSSYNPNERELVTEIPEGTVYLRLGRVVADRDAMHSAVDLAGRRAPSAVGEPVDGSVYSPRPFHWLPVAFEYRIIPSLPYAGQFGPLAFEDPWWKVTLVVLSVLLGTAALIDDALLPKPDRFQVDFQLAACTQSNVVRVGAPDTVGGAVLAGAAVCAALATALSDEIDPTREGQEATVPPAGAVTLEEYARVAVSYPEFPRPGAPFSLDATWEYERRTDHGALSHREAHAHQNPHVLLYHRLFTHRARYTANDTIRLFGVVIPPDNHDQRSPASGAYHPVALLHPTALDRSYPVVLRATNELPDAEAYLAGFWEVIERARVADEERDLLERYQRQTCFYYGEYPAFGLPEGAWIHWMHVQTVNTVRPGTNPLIAAQTIGGLPLSNHYRGTLNAICGPFPFAEDGRFAIEHSDA